MLKLVASRFDVGALDVESADAPRMLVAVERLTMAEKVPLPRFSIPPAPM
jgi:hypothetical protein